MVLDASALIAWLRDEPGAEVVQHALDEGSVISAVNLAEVLTRFQDAAVDLAQVIHDLKTTGLVTVPYDQGDAQQTAAFRAQTRALGLSLGDRACLALAARLGRPALTADRVWADIDVGVTITLIR